MVVLAAVVAVDFGVLWPVRAVLCAPGVVGSGGSAFYVEITALLGGSRKKTAAWFSFSLVCIPITFAVIMSTLLKPLHPASVGRSGASPNDNKQVYSTVKNNRIRSRKG